MNVYPFIEAENAGNGNVDRACALLKVSRSAYYAHRTAGPSARRRQDTVLTAEIIAIHDESKGTYGTPCGHAEPRARGRLHSRKRVARLLRTAGLVGRAPKRWRTTTVPDPAATTPYGTGSAWVCPAASDRRTPTQPRHAGVTGMVGCTAGRARTAPTPRG